MKKIKLMHITGAIVTFVIALTSLALALIHFVLGQISSGIGLVFSAIVTTIICLVFIFTYPKNVPPEHQIKVSKFSKPVGFLAYNDREITDSSNN